MSTYSALSAGAAVERPATSSESPRVSVAASTGKATAALVAGAEARERGMAFLPAALDERRRPGAVWSAQGHGTTKSVTPNRATGEFELGVRGSRRLRKNGVPGYALASLRCIMDGP
jgi:hypothetical protein